MSREKRDVNFAILKDLIEEAGLSTTDLISKLADIGAFSKCTSCDRRCDTCNSGCSSGPNKRSELEQLINPSDLNRLKQEILAELKR